MNEFRNNKVIDTTLAGFASRGEHIRFDDEENREFYTTIHDRQKKVKVSKKEEKRKIFSRIILRGFIITSSVVLVGSGVFAGRVIKGRKNICDSMDNSITIENVKDNYYYGGKDEIFNKNTNQEITDYVAFADGLVSELSNEGYNIDQIAIKLDSMFNLEAGELSKSTFLGRTQACWDAALMDNILENSEGRGK